MALGCLGQREFEDWTAWKAGDVLGAYHHLEKIQGVDSVPWAPPHKAAEHSPGTLGGIAAAGRSQEDKAYRVAYQAVASLDAYAYYNHWDCSPCPEADHVPAAPVDSGDPFSKLKSPADRLC